VIKYNLFLFGTVLLFYFVSWAADGKANPKIIDFEADLIEGERSAPNVFIEIEPHRPGLDLILYQRNNFNDFHASERNRRPRYISGRSIPGAVNSINSNRDTHTSGQAPSQHQQKKGK